MRNVSENMVLVMLRKDYYEVYGKDYTNLLRKVKSIFDPNGIINPDRFFHLNKEKRHSVFLCSC